MGDGGEGARPVRFLSSLGSALFLALLAAPVLVAGCAPGVVPGGTPSPEEIPGLEAHLRDRPDDRDARARLGAAYLEADRSDRALEVLEPTATLAPPHSASLFLWATALEEEGRWADARQAWERYLESGDGGTNLRSRVERRLELVRHEELREDVRTAVEQEEAMADRAPDPRAVAVFPFVYEGEAPEYEPLGRALAEMVVTDLGQVDRITVLERLRAQALVNEIALADEDRVDPATAARGGRMLGAGRVVQGRIHGDEALLGVAAGVVAAEAEGEVATLTDEDALEAFFDLQKRLVLGLFDAMAMELTAAERERVLERPTENLQAILLFGRALEAEDRGDFLGAAQLFEQASMEDPAFQEAERRTERARILDEQASVPPESFRASGTDLLPAAPAPAVTPAAIREALRPMDDLVPGPEERDAGAELLGTEGVGVGPSTLDIILRRP